MAVFDFIGHVISENPPESSLQIKFGRGYQFATEPRGPDQTEVILSFRKGLFWMEDQNTRLMSATANPQLNILRLINFYKEHRQAKVFDYNHAIIGLTKYRFAKPVPTPEITDEPNAIGALNGYRTHQTVPFQVVLILQP